MEDYVHTQWSVGEGFLLSLPPHSTLHSLQLLCVAAALLCFCVGEEGMDDDVNGRDGPGRTHLHRLCSLPLLKERDLADLTRLLHSGADPNLDDSFERAPLALLCMHSGNLGAARALLSAGALPSAQDAWGRTPLHWCCDRGWYSTAELLLAQGALVNATTKQGDSPLLWAAKAGHTKLVELLIRSGCHPHFRNNRNESALDGAADDVTRGLLSCWEVDTLTILSGFGQSSSDYSSQATSISYPCAAIVQETLPCSGQGNFFPSLQNAEEEVSTNKSTNKTIPLEEQATLSKVKSTAPIYNNESTYPRNDGAPPGVQTATLGGLFSAYKKQTPGLASGSGSGPGPKKMKITLKNK